MLILLNNETGIYSFHALLLQVALTITLSCLTFDPMAQMEEGQREFWKHVLLLATKTHAQVTTPRSVYYILKMTKGIAGNC